MNVLTKFTRAIGDTVKFKPQNRSARRQDGRLGMRSLQKGRGSKIVEVEVPVPRVPVQIEPVEPKISKQELLTELQQNYKEVIELVRKVNGRLDEQETRAKRLMEIAERVPGAMDLIPELNEHSARSANTLTEIADATKAANQRAEAAAQTHDRVMESLGDRLNSAAEAENRVGETLGDLNTTIGSMTGATDQLAVVMRGVQHRDVRRDEQVQALLGKTQRWMLAAVVLCASSVVISLAIALFR